MNFIYNDIVFWSVYIVVISISTLLVIKSQVHLNKFSIPMWVYYNLFIFSYIGYPIIYYKVIPYYVNLGVVNNEIIMKMFFISSIVIIQFFLGYYACSKLVKRNLSKDNYLNIASNKNMPKKLWITIFLICIIILIYYLIKVPHIALFESVKGSSGMELAKFRSDMTNGFPKYHRFSLFFKGILPFLSYIAFAEFLLFKKKSWKFFFIISFIVTSFSMLMDVQKAPIFWYIFGLVAVVFVCFNKEVKIKHVLSFGILIAIAIFLSYVGFMGSKFELSTILSPIRRGLSGQIVLFYHYLEIFPNEIPFQYGKTFPNPGGILPWESFPYTVEIMSILKQNNGVIGSAPTAFWGELWVNFGWKGMFIIPFFFGALIYYIHRLFYQRSLSSVGIALMIWMAFEFKNLAFTGFSGFLFPFRGVFIISICIAFKILDGRFKTRKKSRYL